MSTTANAQAALVTENTPANRERFLKARAAYEVADADLEEAVRAMAEACI